MKGHSAPTNAILVVDDDPMMLRLLDSVLAKLGNRIVLAGGGARAIELLDSEPFRVVITDLEMPGIDGFAVLDAARAKQPHAALIVVSASKTAAGVEVIKKPIDPPRFLERVRAVLADSDRAAP